MPPRESLALKTGVALGPVIVNEDVVNFVEEVYCWLCPPPFPPSVSALEEREEV